jgi:bacterioferritin
MSFLKNIEEIRQRARQTMEDGAVTQDYRLDRAQAVRVLNEALATEIVCVLRYRFHHFMATGIHSSAVA